MKSPDNPSNKTSSIGLIFMVVTLLLGAPLAGLSHSKGIYQSKEEAQKRADEIGCITVLQNNDRWMPCADERELHRQLRKQ